MVVMTPDERAALDAVHLAGAAVERASVEVDRAKRALDALNAERDALAAEVARLTRQVQAVKALHQPCRIYDECECDDDAKHDGDHVSVDEVGMTCNVMYVVCRECCCDGTDREYQREDCANYHEHTLDPALRCQTTAALATTDDTEEES